jgi:hypothetical protein
MINGQRLQLVALRASVKLEILGMKRSGRSATVIAKELLGLPKSTRKQTVLDKLEQVLAN